MNFESTPTLGTDNPFPGLRPFEAEETHLFFGRDGQSTDIIVELERTRFVGVVGTSGSGKSSLVRAGLLPQLEGGFMSRAGSCWRIALMKPGDGPIRNLASALASPAVLGERAEDAATRAAQIEAVLRRSSVGLIDAVRQARLETGENVLIVVDQFEELFRMACLRAGQGQDEAAAFVALLIEASRQTERAVYVVLTMRSDFVGDCAQFRDLPETLNRGQYLIPRMSRDERREAIEGPVAVGGARIAPRLVQQILNDVGDNPDQLPVMQHALMRTWEAWKRDGQPDAMIDVEHYRRIGALDKALSEHADQALGELTDPADREIARLVFQRLCERAADFRETRRPARLSELCEVANASEVQVIAVIDRFRTKGRTFLVPPYPDKLDGSIVIDISHEALIRQWGTLQEWVKAEAESAAMYERLATDAAMHAEQKVSTWRGPLLAAALAWREKRRPTAAWAKRYHPGFDAAMAFLDKSAEAAQRARRSARLRIGSIAFLAIVITVGLPWLLFAQQVALRKAASEMQQKTSSRELSNEALLGVARDPVRSAYLATEAIKQDKTNIQAEHALRQALAAFEITKVYKIVPFGKSIVDARLTLDKSRLVVATDDKVMILDARTLEKGSQVDVPGPLQKAWLIGNNARLLTYSIDGKLQIQGLDGPATATPMPCGGRGGVVSSVTVSQDERRVAVGCRDGEISVWDVTSTPAKQQQPLARSGGSEGSITALTFSADGRYFAAGDTAGQVIIWQVGQSVPVIGARKKGGYQTPVKHAAAILDISFHPKLPNFVATASDDKTAKVWELDYKTRGLARITSERPENNWPLQHDRPVSKVRFFPRQDSEAGELLTVSDKRVYFWVNDKSKQPRRHDDWVEDVDVSDDGEYAATASSDGTARTWSTRSGATIAILTGHRNTVNRVFFASNTRLFTTSLDGTLRAWTFRPPNLLASEQKWMLSAAFDPTGTRVVVCGEPVASVQCRVIYVGAPRKKNLSLEGVAEYYAVSNATWSEDGQYIAALQASQDIYKEIKPVLWNSLTGKRLQIAWLDEWRTAAFSQTTKELATVNSDGEIAVWDLTQLIALTPKPKVRFTAKAGRWWAEIGPDGRWVAALEDNQVALLDRSAPESSPRLLPHKSEIKSARFSPDGKLLVTASGDRAAYVWRVDTHTGASDAPAKLRGGHSAALSSATFSHDGQRIATSSADGTIGIWTPSGAELVTLSWHGDSVNEVQFDPNGDRILSASDDGTVKLGQCEACRLSAEELQERARELPTLSPEESEELGVVSQGSGSSKPSLTRKSTSETPDRK